MLRRLALAALALALLVLTAPPAAAKGPFQVSVHDERSGTTTFLDGLNGPPEDQRHMRSIVELVTWPSEIAAPKPLLNGRAELIATLTWQYDEQNTAWVDSIYASPSGRTWVERKSQMPGQGRVTWGRVPAGTAFATVLSAIGAQPTPKTEAPERVASAPEEPTTDDPSASAAGAASDGWDGASFGWGAGSAALLMAGLLLGKRGWRQRS